MTLEAIKWIVQMFGIIFTEKIKELHGNPSNYRRGHHGKE
jgi:hypothetical protein